MLALQDLFASERGLFALVLVLAATVLTALGHMPVTQWQDFALWVFGIYAGTKTVTSSVGLLKRPAPTTAAGVIEAVTSVAPAPAEPAA
jgi:hypothetical protein